MEKIAPNWLPINSSWVSPFNTPLECGLRLAILLLESYPKPCDLQRLTQYDYLLVHSGDIEGGPASIHPATPHRSGELHVRRQVIEEGLNMMMTKSIVECVPLKDGIFYQAGDWAIAFISPLNSSYSLALKESSRWVIERFGSYTDAELSEFIDLRWKKWGAEFSQSPLSLLSE